MLDILEPISNSSVVKIRQFGTWGLLRSCTVCVIEGHRNHCHRSAILDFVMNHSRLFAAPSEIVLSARFVSVG
jgi:hypothetical protein